MTRYWTEEEVEYLKQNYNTTEMNVMMAYLNRSSDATHNKARKLGLPGFKTKYHTPFSVWKYRDYFTGEGRGRIKLTPKDMSKLILTVFPPDRWMTANELSEEFNNEYDYETTSYEVAYGLRKLRQYVESSDHLKGVMTSPMKYRRLKYVEL